MLYQAPKARLSAKQWQCVGVLGGIVLFGFVFVFIPAIFGAGPRLTLAPTERAMHRLEETKARSYINTLKDKVKFTNQLITKQETVNNKITKDLEQAEQDKLEFVACAEKINKLNECVRNVRRASEASLWLESKFLELERKQ